ncbi:SET domain-containing [Paramuricea clavata]|uniref:SET domain-containing n=1 Tax=Paramuricea clavata TaxID=317549 RepID=A0A6S7JR34_PARCT|nr:SET domain-containing [Paramuricea clavata]
MSKQQKFIMNFLNKIYEGPRPQKNTQTIRKSQRCIANTLKDKQCRKRTAHTPKCWIHLAKQDNLRIKPSRIIAAGKGLYTWKKSIPRGKIIGRYTGRKLTRKQIDQRYGENTATYAVCNPRGRCIDATYTTDGAPRFANDARKTPFKNNSKIKAGRRIFNLKASKSIRPHQEILTSYGNEYWQ